ncbi:hypothetical protein HDU96_004304, partial [Phlyctochytrium bullatum]
MWRRILPPRFSTEIGEKGINLSGGQKQRVSLVRACYSRAGFVLLDDPLSAVDAPTARHMVTEAVCGLLRGRTRVVVTHAVAVTVPRADWVVVLQSGEVVASGRPGEVVGVPGMEAVVSAEAVVEATEMTAGLVEGDAKVVDFANGKTREDARRLVAAEEQQKGAVKPSVYARYLVAAGGMVFLGVWWTAQIVDTCLLVADSFWVKRWVEAHKEANSTGTVGLAMGGLALAPGAMME